MLIILSGEQVDIDKSGYISLMGNCIHMKVVHLLEVISEEVQYQVGRTGSRRSQVC